MSANNFGGTDPFSTPNYEESIGPSMIEDIIGPTVTDLDNLDDLLFTDNFKFSVYYKPMLKLVEVDYSGWISSKILDFPPTPPIVLFWPIKDSSTRFNISLSPSSGEIRQFPIAMRTTDTSYFRDLLVQQNSSDQKVTFKYEGEILQYEMFRIEIPPTSWKTFTLDPTSVVKTFRGNENFLFQEKIESNKEYFYTFRTYDFHSKVSNPSPIYKVRIYENDGVEFLDVSVYNFPEKKKITSKTFRKFIRINTALEQQTYLEPNESIGRPGKLGLFNESVYNQNFVLRIRSKHTGKILDVVLNFVKEDIIPTTT